MIHSYQILQLGALLLALTGCPSADTPSGSDISPNSGTARLSWDASTGTNIAGYKVYLATVSGVYGTPVATISVGVTTYTLTGLATGTTYFFAVTAFDLDGIESTFSNEVSKSIP